VNSFSHVILARKAGSAVYHHSNYGWDVPKVWEDVFLFSRKRQILIWLLSWTTSYFRRCMWIYHRYSYRDSVGTAVAVLDTTMMHQTNDNGKQNKIEEIVQSTLEAAISRCLLS
jgi:hypothetical protein